MGSFGPARSATAPFALAASGLAAATALADVPLGEARETYVVRVIVNGNVVRETQVISPSWTYNAPLALIDGATGHYSVEVAQVSERYGAGPTRTLVVAA